MRWMWWRRPPKTPVRPAVVDPGWLQAAQDPERWDTERLLVVALEEWDEAVELAHALHVGGESTLMTRVEWLLRNHILVEEDLKQFRKAFKVRTRILADDEHDVPLPILRQHTAVMVTQADRVVHWAPRIPGGPTGG